MAAITIKRSLVVAVSSVALSAGAFMACEQRHVFRSPEVRGCRTVEVPKTVDVPRAADILFVIDNSGSMTEEQQNLAANSSSIGGANNCNTGQKVVDLRTFIKTRAGATPVGEWPATFGAEGATQKAVFEDCGFIERLLLFENDFQIGVITTDMGTSDFPPRMGGGFSCSQPITPPFGRTSLPMRGCLIPAGNSPTRLITARDGNGDVELISSRFKDAVLNVSTCGNAYEQGLGAVEAFLSPDTVRASPTCDNDLSLFLRHATCLKPDGGTECIKDSEGNDVMGPEPKLIVLILSDEEDCSNSNNADAGGFNIGSNNAGQCYRSPDRLYPTQRFIDFLRGVKGDPDLVSMAAIVGGYFPDPADRSSASFVAGNCRCNASSPGAAPVASDMCHATLGNSIVQASCGMRSDDVCGGLPQIATATNPNQGDGGVIQECCTADIGSRYVEVARGMSRFLVDSICEQNYRDTMIDVANLINTSDTVPLGEKPADPRQVQVEVKGANGAFRVVPTYTARSEDSFKNCQECALMDCQGWGLVDDCKTVKFYGSEVPPPGSEIRVTFLGATTPDGPRCNTGAE